MNLFKRLLPGVLCATLLCSLLTAPSLAVTGTVVGSDNKPLASAKVVCEIQENGTWREWASEFYQIGDVDPSLYPDLKEGAEDYGQSPSMYTGEDGRCGWMLPPGTYRFKVTADGYKEFTSAAFTVGNQSGNVDNSHDLNQLKLSPNTPTPPPSGIPTPTPTPSGDPTPTPTPTPGDAPTPSPSPSSTPSYGGGDSAPISVPKTANLMTLNLAAGTVPKGSQLTLTATDDKAAKNVTFHYTTDGSTPNRKSAQFTDPIVIDKNMTVKIIAIKGSARGTVESYTFTVSDEAARPGSLSPEASATRYLVGYDDGTFRPDQPATRYEVVEALKYLLVLGDGSTASPLSDVLSAHSVSVSRLVEAGIINGYEDGTFQGDGSLTRVQICKILCVVLGLESDPQYSQTFSDVAGHWGIGFIGALAKEGYLKGYDDGSFRPDRPVTRAELAALLNRVAGRKDVAGGAVEYSDVPSDFWAYDDIHNACLDIKAVTGEK